ncbi:MAG: hypothetical protein RMJ17_02250 [Candidatus Aenigmarchaeota archaeon]|nr:hypothetical protein [Candidatus Aenigmarchaeota archaeon]MDW8149394.1 hypothetical protein [Candidatus Aenigmarchaeota archaeon]
MVIKSSLNRSYETEYCKFIESLLNGTQFDSNKLKDYFSIYNNEIIVKYLREIGSYLEKECKIPAVYTISDILVHTSEHFKRLGNDYKKQINKEDLFIMLSGHVISHNGVKVKRNKGEEIKKHILEKILPKYGFNYRIDKWRKEPDEPNGILNKYINNQQAQYKPNRK